MYLFYFLLTVLAFTQDISNLSQYSVKLYGNISFGYYYINMFIGNPPQIQALIVDTGSHVMTVPYQQCDGCSWDHLHPNYNREESPTSSFINCSSQYSELCQNCYEPITNPDRCEFTIAYQEGSSIKGVLITDTVTFRNDLIINSSNQDLEQYGVQSIMGITTEYSQKFKYQRTNGIIGLSPERKHSFIEQIYGQHENDSNFRYGFSLCLAKDGGYLTLGKNHEILHDNPNPKTIHYQPQPDNLYRFHLTGVKFDTQEMIDFDHNNQLEIIIDSGATYTQLIPEIFQPLYDRILQICQTIKCQKRQKKKDRCLIMPGGRLNVIKNFPSIFITLQDTELQWIPDNYLVRSPYNPNQYCLGFQKYENGMILGATWMRGRDIFFDLQMKWVQIYESKCFFPDEEKRYIEYDTLRDESFYLDLDFLSKYGVHIGVVLLILALYSDLTDKKNNDLKKKEQQANKLAQKSQ